MSEERRIVVMPTYCDENGVPTCPKCGCQDFEVTHTYAWSHGVKKRRRTCSNCRWPVTTIEIISEGE